MGIDITSGRTRAVFFDRDGVLNAAVIREGKPYPPAGLQEVVIPEDAVPSLSRLKEHGFLLIVVTNQPDVRRGAAGREDVEAIHEFLRARLPLDDIFVCYHDDEDGCLCRKPSPGLLLDAAAKYGIELRSSYLVGDRWRDIDAGAAAGCRTILLDRRYQERRPRTLPDLEVASLSEATEWIVKQEIR